MKKKNYELFSRAKQAFWALALTVLWGTAYAQTTYTFMYTANVQTLSVQGGNYEIECWGANGGAGGTGSALTGTGGIGGYSKGVYAVTSPTVLYIYVGGAGQSTNTSGANFASAAGGWNGGGSGWNGATNTNYRGGGGGGSDVRTTLNTTYANRIIVAGGGGGSGGSTSAGYVGSGGKGGGTTGQDGILGSSQSNHNGKGGTQSAGGAGGIYSSSSGVAGAFGIGGSGGGSGNTFPAGGGGGGWYGGGGGAVQGGGGGGGSGYIGGVTSATTAMSGQAGFVPNPVTTGNGLVIIKELCNISLLANGSPNSQTICAGQSLSLTTSAVSNYTWSTGANTSSIVVSPTSTVVYSLVATSSLNCQSSAQLSVTVHNGVPSLTVVNTASATGGVCPSKTVALTASGATTYTWTGGNPVTNGVAFAPSSASGYTVTGENACGTSTAATSVSIHTSPTTSATISQPTICSVTGSIVLTGFGNAPTYTWSHGGPNGSTIYPQVSSTYTVTGINSNSCTSFAVISVTVVPTPVAQPLASPPAVCIGKSSTITATGATGYTITTPTGTFFTAAITVTPNATTIYTVTKSNSNCVNTQTVSVIVNMLPPVNGIATPTVVCASTSLALQAIGATSFTWTAPNYTSTSATPTVFPASATVYSLTGFNGTCTASTTVQVSTNPNPTITVVPTTTAICLKDSVTIIATGADNYTWTTTGGTVATNDTIRQSPIANVFYAVIGINQHGCTSSSGQPIVVNPLPNPNVQTTKPLVCPGGISTLTVTGVGLSSYQWDSNAANATTSIVSVNPMTTTVYKVTAFFPTMCNTSKTIQVTVFQPTFAVNSPTSSCKGGTINLIANGASSYTWNGTQPFSQISVSPPTETVYIVSATSASNGVNCISTKTVQVDIYENPIITAKSEKATICLNESVKLIGGGGVTYNWSSSQNGATVTVSPKITQTYNVIGTDQNGCKGTATVQVKVSPCSGIDEQAKDQNRLSVFPNPSNGQFTIKASVPVTLTLSNELGQLLEVIELNEANNYQKEVRTLATGIYFLKGEGISEKIVITN